MDITITAKVKLNTDSDSELLLRNTMIAYRDACNYVSAYVFQTHDLKQASVHRHLYRNIRNDYGLRSQMAGSVIKTVIARYKTILSQNKEWIQPVFKKCEYDLVWNRDYSLVMNTFSVNTLNGRLKLSFYKQGMEQYFNKNLYKFGTAKLVYKHKKFFLHIPVTTSVKECKTEDICNVVGIDRGINFVVTTYDSKGNTCFISGRQIKQKRAKYKELRRQLQQRQTASARRRLKKIGERENRWMQDINHCISKALVQNNPQNTLFVLEDLTGIRNATEKVVRKHRYEIVSWSFYDLEEKLMYKSLMNSQKVIKVNPRYTSQTCPRCGHTDKKNRDKKSHIFTCRNCGYTSNDDRIAAMNLYRKGINYVSNCVPDTVIQE